MKCPNCNHVSEKTLLKCGECGEYYDRETLEEFQHIQYLIAWLENQDSSFGAATLKRLLDEGLKARKRVEQQLFPEGKPIPPHAHVPEAPVTEPQESERVLLPELAPQLARLLHVQDLLPVWRDKNLISPESFDRLCEYLNQKARDISPEFGENGKDLPEVTPSEVKSFVMQSLGFWSAGRLISEEELRNLQAYFEQPAPVQVKEPEVRVVKAGDIDQAALLHATAHALMEWSKSASVGMDSTAKLRKYLLQERERLASGKTLPNVQPEKVRSFVLSNLLRWNAADLLTQEAMLALRNLLVGAEKPRPQPAAMPVAAAAAPVAKPAISVPAKPAKKPKKEKPPPEPREPLIKWDEVWGKIVEAAVSGLLLRWLRYLGAFLFVVSIAIVVINFWNDIPQFGQVAIIFFVPTAFYVGGWVLRKRLQVVQTGGVLMGVGQILLAVDFAAIYQFGGLTFPLQTYWLITSGICTLLYILSVRYVIQAEFFGYIGLVGFGSTIAAVVAIATKTVAWPLVAAAAVGVFSVEFGYRLGSGSEKWQEVADSAKRFPQFMLPLILLALFLIPEPGIEWAQTTAFAMATIAFAVLSWRFGELLHTHIAVWSSAITVFLVLQTLGVSWEWYATGAGVLSMFYLMVMARLQRADSKTQAALEVHILPFKIGHLALMILALVGAIAAIPFEIWAAIAGLLLTSVVMGASTYVLGAPLLGLAAGAILFLPVTLAAREWLTPVPQKNTWLPVVWIGLALVYLGFTALQRNLKAYVRWFALLTQFAIPFSLFVALFQLLSSTEQFLNPVIAVLSGSILVYVFSAIMHDQGKHPALSEWVEGLPDKTRQPIFMTAAAVLVPVLTWAIWGNTNLQMDWLAAVLSGIAFGYVWLGYGLGRRKPVYEYPFRILTYAVGLAAVLPALQSPTPLIFALYLNVAALAVLAWRYQSMRDTAVASLLLPVPFLLMLDRLNIAVHAYALGLILLAGLVYIPLAGLLRRRVLQDMHHLPIWVIGYGLSAAALLLSLLGRFDVFAHNVRWVGMLVPLLASALYGYSAVTVHPGFSWAAAAVFPIAFGQGLTLFIRPDWNAPAWVALGFAYLLLGVLPGKAGERRFTKTWYQLANMPLNLGAWLLVGLGFVLTLDLTIEALSFGLFRTASGQYVAPVTAQALSAGFVVLAAVFYRRRLPLFLQPWLTFLPVTLALVGFGAAWFGRDLTSKEFAVPWAFLGAAHFLAALVSDQLRKKKERTDSFATGVHLGGYLMVVFSVFWSIGENIPFLWSLAILIGVSIGSAVLAHTNNHPAFTEALGLVISAVNQSVFSRVLRSLFVWITAWTIPIWIVVFLAELPLAPGFEWLGFIGAALASLIAAPWLGRKDRGYTWPFNLAGQFYAALGVFLTMPFTGRALAGDWAAAQDQLTGFAVIAVQIAAVVYYAGFAYAHRKQIWGYLFPYVAAMLVVVPFTVAFQLYGVDLFGQRLHEADFGVAWVALAGVLLLIAAWLDRKRTGVTAGRVPELTLFTAHGPYLLGYGLAGFGLIWALVRWFDQTQLSMLWTGGIWIGLMAASAVWVHLKRHRTWVDVLRFVFGEAQPLPHRLLRDVFIWLSAWSFPVWLTVLLWELGVVLEFGYLGYVFAALGYLGAVPWLGRKDRGYTWPFNLAGQFYAALGVFLTMPFTGRALAGDWAAAQDQLTGFAVIAVQIAAVVYYAGFAYAHRKQIWGYLFPFIAALLVVAPFTVAFQVYGVDLFGQRLHEADFGAAWVALAGFLLLIAALLDRKRTGVTADRVPELTLFTAHGPYLVGYGLAGFALIWALVRWFEKTQLSMLWTGGIWIGLMAASAVWVHLKRHRTWVDVLRFVFGEAQPLPHRLLRDVFIWLSAWSFPVWLTVLLWELGVVLEFGYLGYVFASLAFYFAAIWLGRKDRSYAWPFNLAGQFFTLFALAMTVSFSIESLNQNQFESLWAGKEIAGLGLILVQSGAIVYYGVSSWYFRTRKWPARLFALAAAFLTWIPYSLAWIVYKYKQLDYGLGYGWLGLAAGMLLVGLGLDQLESRRGRKQRVGFAHGPYLAGYLGLVYMLFWTWPDRLVSLYITGGIVLLLVLSQFKVYKKLHPSWMAFVNRFFDKAGPQILGGLRSGFLWIAAYLFPVWLTSLLAYQEVPWAWRGLALALVAPLYIAGGLFVRSRDPAYQWPLFTAGYLLTAIGAMVSFGDVVLAMYVLGLNAVVYAVSAYIFNQSVWLYLTTILTPVIAMMALQYNLDAMPAPWLAGIFMGLAYLYTAIGRGFDRVRKMDRSQISSFAMAFYGPGFLLSALGLAVSTEQRELAVITFLAGVVLYGFSAWSFREPVFMFPAVWLAAVPYYLGMTYTAIEPTWYGIGWLPLMSVAFVIGRRFFHRQPDLKSLTHAAMPFYTLVHGLSMSMLLLSTAETLTLAVAFAAAAVLYLISARLFRRAIWLYPGLLMLHLSLVSFMALEPSGGHFANLAVAFLPVTALMVITGAWLWKHQERLETQGWKDLALTWALPFLVFGSFDLVFWQILSLFKLEMGMIAAVGHGVILAVTALLWMSTPVVWASLGYLVLAISLRLLPMELSLPVWTAYIAGAGFIFYLAGQVLDELAGRIASRGTGERPHPGLKLWAGPVRKVGIGAAVLGFAPAVALVFADTSAVAFAMIFAGAVGLSESYRRKVYWLGYAAVGVIELAYVLLMLQQEISQPQWYAIPVGLYMVGVAFFERRRGRMSFATLLESFGFIAMLLTSFGQSLNKENDLIYFLLMLVEAVLIIAWSAQQRRKVPFLIGAGGVLANLIGQIVMVFLGGTTLIRWIIFGGLGLLILLAAIYAERWIIPRAQELRERLEAWS